MLEGGDRAQHEREKGMIVTIFDALFGDPRKPSTGKVLRKKVVRIGRGSNKKRR